MRYLIDTNVLIHIAESGYISDDVRAIESHRDPNDRLIIAQAITEKMPLISNDTKFPKYTRFGLDFIPNR